MERLKGFFLSLLFLFGAFAANARPGYSLDELEKRIYTHPESAEKEIYRYLYVAKKSGRQLAIGKGYYLVGKLSCMRLNLEQSAKAYKKSLAIFQQLGNEKLEAKTNQGIGLLYAEMKDFKRALVYRRKNLYYQLKSGHPKQKADAFLAIACNKRDTEEYDSAFYYCNDAAAICRRENHLQSLARVYLLSVALSCNTKDYKLGLAYSFKALQIARACKDQNSIQGGLAFIGVLHRLNGDADSAKYYLHKALDLATRDKVLDMQGSIYKELSEIYDEEDSTELAHSYLRRYYAIKDTLLSPQKINRINKIRFGLSKANTSQSWMLSWSIPILVPTASLTYFLYRRKRKKGAVTDDTDENLQLEQAFSRQQKELISKSMQIQQQSKLIEWTKAELNNLRLDGQEKQQVHLLSGLLASANSNNWSEFERHFNDMQPGFYEKLLTDYPQLTVNERRLSGFISLNLSNREISEITRKSVRSIEVAKYRLRSKLELSKEQQLSAKLAEYL